MLRLFWLLPLATLIQEMSALKKGKKKTVKKIRGNKKGQVPGTSKKRKSETRGQNGQVSDSRIRGTRYPPERKKKRKRKKHRASHSPQKASKCKKGMYPLKRAKVELDFHHYYHHHHHTPFIRHTCTS